jgi:hypothetical protein
MALERFTWGKPERFTWGKTSGGCETLQPGCHGQVSREANTPKTRLVAANLQQQGEARTMFLKDSGIPVLS